MQVEIKNAEGVVIRIGDRVQHRAQGYKGTVVAVKNAPFVDLLHVLPDEITEVPKTEWWVLSPKVAELIQRKDFCRPRDNGEPMYNWFKLAEDRVYAAYLMHPDWDEPMFFSGPSPIDAERRALTYMLDELEVNSAYPFSKKAERVIESSLGDYWTIATGPLL